MDDSKAYKFKYSYLISKFPDRYESFSRIAKKIDIVMTIVLIILLLAISILFFFPSEIGLDYYIAVFFVTFAAFWLSIILKWDRAETITSNQEFIYHQKNQFRELDVITKNRNGGI